VSPVPHGYRPCGECVAYVPEKEGCEHWRPQAGIERARKDRRNQRNAELRRRQNEELARIRLVRAMGLGLRG